MRVIAPHEKYALLIVEGDAEARRNLEEAARECDRFWSIRAMADGRFALEYLWTCLEKNAKDIPDIVITNPELPGLSGIQLTRDLRRYEELCRLFVAMLSPRAAPMEQDEAESAGCDFFLRRPTVRSELEAVLRSIANRCGMKVVVKTRLLS
jgi:CheY-like chemotaxis protein